jgi:hypothetical protein
MADVGDPARQPRLITLRGPTVSPKTGVAKAVFQARGITKI